MTHRLPSDDLELEDSIAAHCVDDAVLWFGLTVENALNEQRNVGTPKEPKWEPKYSLSQLLDPIFRLPKPAPVAPPKTAQSGFVALLAMARQKGSGVKLWTGVKAS